MLFNSWEFALVFLPITVFVYFTLIHLRRSVAAKAWLVVASLFFYAHWDANYLSLIIGSIVFNFTIGSWLAKSHASPLLPVDGSRHEFHRNQALAFGVASNLLLLGYYKYTGFLAQNLNALTGMELPVPNIVLPLAISFFTFTQIVYLVDSYRGETAEYNLLNYALFVTFFPHLIAGPIVHHRQIMPQFASRWTLIPNARNVLKGFVIFAIGLFKKVIIADSFSDPANAGFDSGQPVDFFSAWATSLSYTLQIYFDFSGYCDMAIGAALFFNIVLPVNFNSPYKALNIQDFWRRWHITLSSFLRDYLYIPLGGNRGSGGRTTAVLFITFILGGLWHGASWMFLIWGGLHGAGIAAYRLWQLSDIRLPKALSWAITFFFINLTWVFFRAKTLDDAFRVLRGMTDIQSISDSPSVKSLAAMAWSGRYADTLCGIFPATLIGQLPTYALIAMAMIIITQKSAVEILESAGSINVMILSVMAFASAMHMVMASTSSVFLYFTF